MQIPNTMISNIIGIILGINAQINVSLLDLLFSWTVLQIG